MPWYQGILGGSHGECGVWHVGRGHGQHGDQAPAVTLSHERKHLRRATYSAVRTSVSDAVVGGTCECQRRCERCRSNSSSSNGDCPDSIRTSATHPCKERLELFYFFTVVGRGGGGSGGGDTSQPVIVVVVDTVVDSVGGCARAQD
jgi:hypothetical protein